MKHSLPCFLVCSVLAMLVGCSCSLGLSSPTEPLGEPADNTGSELPAVSYTPAEELPTDPAAPKVTELAEEPILNRPDPGICIGLHKNNLHIVPERLLQIGDTLIKRFCEDEVFGVFTLREANMNMSCYFDNVTGLVYFSDLYGPLRVYFDSKTKELIGTEFYFGFSNRAIEEHKIPMDAMLKAFYQAFYGGSESESEAFCMAVRPYLYAECTEPDFPEDEIAVYGEPFVLTLLETTQYRVYIKNSCSYKIITLVQL
ncbi:MAG: hypothetical protein ACOX6U_05340 [Oscillospiraceae bacterium]|jgi:hypothetical protein